MDNKENSLLNWCKTQGREDILDQWHPDRNGGLTPDGVAYGSRRKVWWQCEKGHVWQSVVYSRTSGGAGCPCCNAPDCGSLLRDYPAIAAQWLAEKNLPVTVDEVSSGSSRKVWWQCEKGHQWCARIRSRVVGDGCPVCAGRKVLPGENDLASTFPEIAAQWHSRKNNQLTPSEITANSHRRVWWQCEAGHAYEASVSCRAYNLSGCPYCSSKKILIGFNDLGTCRPTVAAQWHTTLNGNLTPQMVMPGSHRRVWWQCPEGHVWKAVIYSRATAQRRGCPVCAGNVKRKNIRRDLDFTVQL